MDYYGIAIIFSIWMVGCIVISFVIYLFSVEQQSDAHQNSGYDRQGKASAYSSYGGIGIFLRYFRALENKIEVYNDKHNRDNKKKSALDFANLAILTVTLIVLAFTCVAIIRQTQLQGTSLADFDREAHIRLRAYLSVLVSPPPKLEPDKSRNFQAVMQVGGQTPASDVIGWVATNEFAYPFPKGAHLPTESEIKFDAPFAKLIVLNPNSTYAYNLSRILVKDTFDRITLWRDERSYVFGKIAYLDVFGCKRWIKYCTTINDTIDPPRVEQCPFDNETEGPAGACPQ